MLVSLAIAASSCSNAGYVRQILDLNRAATTAQSAAPAVYVSTYDYSDGSMTGSQRSTVDPISGRFIYDARIGLTGSAEGFDGRQAWARDLSGYYLPQSGGSKPALAISEAYRNANLWWAPRAGDAQITALGCDHLAVTPKGGQSFEAWFDPATHLLDRVLEMQTFGNVRETRFLDYAVRSGRHVPTRIETISNDDAASPATLRLRSMTRAGKDDGQFSQPKAQPSDWSIPAGGSVTLPFRLINNHIILDVTIDGRGPFPFLLDTGGHAILTPSTLEALDIKSAGKTQSGGAGENRVEGGYAKVGLADVAGAKLRNQTFLTLDFSPEAVEGIKLGGMLGVEWFERFVVRIDYGASTVTISDPATFHAKQHHDFGKAVSIKFYEHMPQVEGRFEGRPARFNIDTGSRSDVTMTSPYVARAGLRTAHPDAITITDGWGVGGASRSTVIRATSLTLGPVTVQRPIAGLSSAAHGSFSDAGYDGNIGSGLLKRYVVTFDYSRRTMYLKPAARLDPDIGRFDRTGMWINLGSGGMEIKDIAAGGPAAEAGLRADDAITSIDGENVAHKSLSDVRRLLRLVPTNRSIRISYRRGGVASHTTLQPRNLIPD